MVWLQTPVGRSKVAVLRERGDHGLKTIGFTPGSLTSSSGDHCTAAGPFARDLEGEQVGAVV